MSVATLIPSISASSTTTGGIIELGNSSSNLDPACAVSEARPAAPQAARAPGMNSECSQQESGFQSARVMVGVNKSPGCSQQES